MKRLTEDDKECFACRQMLASLLQGENSENIRWGYPGYKIEFFRESGTKGTMG